tara:strand:+ start:523 stop:1122 length:600 start_codon:yes stop_codon:yes gene_type:complete
MSSHINPDSGQLVIESTSVLNVGATPVDPVGAALYVKGGNYTAGDLYVHGTLVVNGNVISLGNAGGSLTFNSNINSDVIPNISSGIQFNLGSLTNPWNVGYFQKIVAKTESATTSPITTTTGTVYINGSTATPLTLADGIEGERKAIIVTAIPTGTITVTPVTFLNATSLTFAAVGNSVDLVYTSTGWSILSIYGANLI